MKFYLNIWLCPLKLYFIDKVNGIRQQAKPIFTPSPYIKGQDIDFIAKHTII
jgi:hypothetical protein